VGPTQDFTATGNFVDRATSAALPDIQNITSKNHEVWLREIGQPHAVSGFSASRQ
jgi:hypothetical protein